MQSEPYPALSDQQLLSAAVITEIGDRKADIFLKKGAFVCVAVLLGVLMICTVVAGFLENYALMGLFGTGTIGTAALGGWKKLYAKTFDNKTKPNLIESTQKLIQEKNKTGKKIT